MESNKEKIKKMKFEEYERKYGREIDNNFATACYEDNSIDELHEALTEEPDEYDCREWGITPEEWTDAIQTALTEKLADQFEENEMSNLLKENVECPH